MGNEWKQVSNTPPCFSICYWLDISLQYFLINLKNFYRTDLYLTFDIIFYKYEITTKRLTRSTFQRSIYVDLIWYGQYLRAYVSESLICLIYEKRNALLDNTCENTRAWYANMILDIAGQILGKWKQILLWASLRESDMRVINRFGIILLLAFQRAFGYA